MGQFGEPPPQRRGPERLRYVVYLMALVAELSGMGRDDQLATAGRLTSGSSLIWLIVSSVM